MEGYKGIVKRLLQDAGVSLGDIIRVEVNGIVHQGTLMPKHAFSHSDTLVLKLPNGYNIGVNVKENVKITFVEHGVKPAFSTPPPPVEKEELALVSIVSTGGTIASRVDYRTGAVHPALTAMDLYAVVPELSSLARIKAEILLSLLSENMTPQHWTMMTETIAKHINEGVQGVVVAHGTDTMHYTAAALSFALGELPVPVVLVGSQRSSDRPSSDAASNLIGAVTTAAHAPFAEVGVVMHESTSDGDSVIHRGVKARKCHTSRRDAFKSINASPIARISNRHVTMLTQDFHPRNPDVKLHIQPKFEERVGLVKYHPGMSPEVIRGFIDKGCRGLILEGTGLGHVGTACFDAVTEAVEKGLVVCMTSQCLWGGVRMTVYETGRDLLERGVIPLRDMLLEVALVKLMWTLGQTTNPDVAKRLMQTNLAGEYAERPAWKM